MIITIDGPAGSGKSTTARAVARRLGFRHLESGAFYRALTWAVLQTGLPPNEWAKLDEAALENFGVRAKPAEDGFRLVCRDRDITDELRSTTVNANVSQIARIHAVRSWLLGRLRESAEAARPTQQSIAGINKGLVTDGRDMGTVVFPKAELKVFLTARPEVRARRRLAEYGIINPDVDHLQAETERLLSRDRIDSQREIAPLRRAVDAVDLDTSDLSFEEQVNAIIRIARRRQADPEVDPPGAARTEQRA